LFVGLAVLASLLAIPDAASAELAPARFAYTGNAYGTKVSVGSTVKSGPSAYITLGCTTSAGVQKSNTVLDVNVAPLAFSGTVRTTANTSASPTKSQTTAETEKVNLLGGAVTADLVRAVSSTTRSSGAFQTSSAGSTLVNLRIGTTVISATPGPNTRVNLDGLGYVILNEQVRSVSATKASLTVNMIHAFVTVPNDLGFPLGTDIIVSHAQSGLAGPTDVFLDGRAYGTSLRVGSLVKSGPSAVVYMPCTGTNGRILTNSLLTVNIPGVLTSGTLRNTAQGTVTANTATGVTTATIEKVNLLGGLVTADVVKAVARASSDGTTNTFSDEGSSLLNLSVSGHPEITAETGPNTKVVLAGLGTLYIHRVIRTSTSIEVRMIELVVQQTNTYGLAVGTVLRVAVAEASVH
jgi:hypothetical protein